LIATNPHLDPTMISNRFKHNVFEGGWDRFIEEWIELFEGEFDEFRASIMGSRTTPNTS